MGTDWKETYRRKMSDYSEPAPDGLLDDILAAYDAKSRGRRRTVFLLLSGLAAAAAVAMGLFFGYTGQDRGSDSYIADAVTVQDGSASVAPSQGYGEEDGAEDNSTGEAVADGGNTEITGAEDNDTGEAVADGGNTEVTGTEEPGTVKPVPADRHEVSEIREEETLPAEDMAPDTVQDNNTDINIIREERKEENAVGTDRQAYSWEHLLLADAETGRRRAKPSFSVYASGLSGGSEKHTGYSQAVNTMAEVMPMRYGENALAGILMFNRTKDVSTESRHRLPIRAGISVSYSLTPRWSIGSGLTYSYLFSTSRTGSDSYYVDSRQALHYIGIPLNASFSIWGNRWIDVYVSAGGMLEKCVGGNVRKNYIYGNDPRDAETEKVMVRPLQWSVSAMAGLQFNCSRLIGIYLEPGMTYHFNNGSDVETVYSVHPLNFNLNFGLRFSLE